MQKQACLIMLRCRLFSLFCCKNIAFFPGRTKKTIEKFYGLIDKIYMSTWVAFKESISLGMSASISRVMVSSNVVRIKC